MPDLRERFVQARLSETSLFGQNDVEEWLAREREAVLPHLPEEPTVPIVSQWQRLPGSDLLGLTDQQAAWALIVNNASSVHDFNVEQMAPKIGDWKPYGQLFGTHVDSAGIFVGHKAFVVIELGRRLYIMRILAGLERSIKQEGLVCRPFGIDMELTSRAVADVLLGEWSRNGLNAACAREILCDAVARAVAAERTRAERDFDCAVAVSEDSAKIIKADWVVAVRRKKRSGQYRFIGFPGEAFHDQKIRRRQIIARITTGFPIQTIGVRSVTELVASRYSDISSSCAAVLFASEGSLITAICGGVETRIYIAREEDCPPLPINGGEIVDIS